MMLKIFDGAHFMSKVILFIFAAFIIVIAFLITFDLGQFDPNRKITGTRLTYVDANTLSRYISSETGEILVDSMVIKYLNDGGYVFGLRQPINIFRCSDPSMFLTEVTDRLEFFVIKTSNESPSHEVNNYYDFIEFTNNLSELGIDIEVSNKFSPALNEDLILRGGRVDNSTCAAENRTYIR